LRTPNRSTSRASSCACRPARITIALWAYGGSLTDDEFPSGPSRASAARVSRATSSSPAPHPDDDPERSVQVPQGRGAAARAEAAGLLEPAHAESRQRVRRSGRTLQFLRREEGHGGALCRRSDVRKLDEHQDPGRR
jgi:hypothetical protein